MNAARCQAEGAFTSTYSYGYGPLSHLPFSLPLTCHVLLLLYQASLPLQASIHFILTSSEHLTHGVELDLMLLLILSFFLQFFGIFKLTFLESSSHRVMETGPLGHRSCADQQTSVFINIYQSKFVIPIFPSTPFQNFTINQHTWGNLPWPINQSTTHVWNLEWNKRIRGNSCCLGRKGKHYTDSTSVHDWTWVFVSLRVQLFYIHHFVAQLNNVNSLPTLTYCIHFSWLFFLQLASSIKNKIRSLFMLITFVPYNSTVTIEFW